MNILRLTSNDAQKAKDAVRSLKSDRAGRTGASASLEHLESALGRDDLYLIAAFDDATPAGFLLAYRLPRVDRDREMVLLYDVEVAPSQRRKGIGTALIEKLKEEVRDQDLMKMWVITERSNAAAVHLYESTGAIAQDVADTVVFEWRRTEQ